MTELQKEFNNYMKAMEVKFTGHVHNAEPLGVLMVLKQNQSMVPAVWNLVLEMVSGTQFEKYFQKNPPLCAYDHTDANYLTIMTKTSLGELTIVLVDGDEDYNIYRIRCNGYYDEGVVEQLGQHEFTISRNPYNVPIEVSYDRSGTLFKPGYHSSAAYDDY